MEEKEEAYRALLIKIIIQALIDAFYLKLEGNKGNGRKKVFFGENRVAKLEATTWLRGEFGVEWLKTYCDLLNVSAEYLMKIMNEKLSGEFRDGYQFEKRSQITEELGYDLFGLERDLRGEGGNSDYRRKTVRGVRKNSSKRAGKGLEGEV